MNCKLLNVVRMFFNSIGRGLLCSYILLEASVFGDC